MASCSNDLECPSTMSCYRNVSWDKETELHGKCYCVTEFGWVGDGCTQLGPTSILMLTITFLLLVVLLGLFVSVVRNMCIAFPKQVFREKNRDLIVAMLYVLISVIFFFILKVCEAVALLTPTDLILTSDDGVEYRTHRLFDVKFYFPIAVLGFLGTGLALLRLSLLWLQVAKSATKMNELGYRLKVYKYCAIAFELLFFVSELVLIAMGEVVAGWWAGMPYIVIVFFSFNLESHKYSKGFGSIIENTE
mmetsp:Transcript_16616/g.26950  ORF Transcript_16616/g.26950 Transcript_16616/m.26950 type:complete len:249 (-) Transcript_16616:690-1436(-)